MRRISVENVRLGMTLSRAVFDGRGTLLMDTGTVLDTRHLPILARLEVREVLIQDPRVDDVIIVPLISEEVEAQAVRFLHRLTDGNQDKGVEHIKIDLPALDRVVKTMVQGIYTTFMGELSLEGCLSLGNYDYIHPVKVVGLSLLMGKEMGYSRADLANLGMAALLENIGYVMIPKNVLTNLEPSAEDKSPEFRKHPEIGSAILRRQKGLDVKVAEAVLQHHERWNGKGFPQGLKGEQISPFARIIAIADTYHALVSRRPRQQPYPPPEAAEFIAAFSGDLFDPELAQTFVRNVPFYPRGVMVRLSTGETGFVTDPNIGYIGRPVVRVCCDQRGAEVRKPNDMDLTKAEHQTKVVVEILDY